MPKVLIVLLLGLVSRLAWPNSEDDISINACIERASIKYQVPELLIRATIDVESNWEVMATNRRNQNGTVDYGLMQINSWWLSKLKHFGINHHNIYEPCVNIHVGSWILSNNIHPKGITETTLGAYNAGFSEDKKSVRKRYVVKLAKAVQKRMTGQSNR